VVAVIEGEEHEALLRIGEIADALGELRLLVVRGFQFHRDDVVAQQEQGFAEMGHAEGAQRRGGEGIDAAVGGVGSIEGGVVDDEGLAVAADLHVELDAVGAAPQGGGERGQGVFGVVGRISPVAEKQRAHTGTRLRK
jgi:hypothetical protein